LERRKVPEEYDINKLDMVRSPTFASIYSNNARLGITPWDISMSFSVVEENEAYKVPVLVTQGIVRMSPQHFKAFAAAVAAALTQYEEKFGEIRLPPGIIPEKPS
jgi:Protein of unknown function (DUF3467)